MALAGMKLATEGDLGSLEGIYFISEAWTSVATKKQAKMGHFIRPSLDPYKKEALIVVGKDLVAGKTQVKTFEIVRQGENVDLRENKTDKADTADSPLLDAFEFGYKLASLKGKASAMRPESN